MIFVQKQTSTDLMFLCLDCATQESFKGELDISPGPCDGCGTENNENCVNECED